MSGYIWKQQIVTESVREQVRYPSTMFDAILSANRRMLSGQLLADHHFSSPVESNSIAVRHGVLSQLVWGLEELCACSSAEPAPRSVKTAVWDAIETVVRHHRRDVILGRRLGSLRVALSDTNMATMGKVTQLEGAVLMAVSELFEGRQGATG
jgi:hypothetical protein